MENKFKSGQEVYVEVSPNKWERAIVLSEKFNGGSGGFYTARLVKNGQERTLPTKFFKNV